MTEVELWTDGACGGGARGGWAFIITIPGNPFAYHEESGAVRDTTSQQMELMAFAQALTYISLQPDWASSIVVHTDSSYLKNCFTYGWHKRWAANGWVNSRGKPVANRELWQMILQLVELNTIRWVKIKGHSKVAMNERCDKLAVQARKSLLVSQ